MWKVILTNKPDRFIYMISCRIEYAHTIEQLMETLWRTSQGGDAWKFVRVVRV